MQIPEKAVRLDAGYQGCAGSGKAVVAPADCIVQALTGATVYALARARVIAYDGSTVYASAGSIVYAYEGAEVHAEGGATILPATDELLAQLL